MVPQAQLTKAEAESENARATGLRQVTDSVLRARPRIFGKRVDCHSGFGGNMSTDIATQNPTAFLSWHGVIVRTNLVRLGRGVGEWLIQGKKDVARLRVDPD